MSDTTTPEQTPQSFDSSRISPAGRRALQDHDLEIARGVRRVSDAPVTPSSGLVK
jgi:hypothetical protein